MPKPEPYMKKYTESKTNRKKKQESGEEDAHRRRLIKTSEQSSKEAEYDTKRHQSSVNESEWGNK